MVGSARPVEGSSGSIGTAGRHGLQDRYRPAGGVTSMFQNGRSRRRSRPGRGSAGARARRASSRPWEVHHQRERECERVCDIGGAVQHLVGDGAGAEDEIAPEDAFVSATGTGHQDLRPSADVPDRLRLRRERRGGCEHAQNQARCPHGRLLSPSRAGFTRPRTTPPGRHRHRGPRSAGPSPSAARPGTRRPGPQTPRSPPHRRERR